MPAALHLREKGQWRKFAAMRYSNFLILFKQGNRAARDMAAEAHCWLAQKGVASSIMEACHDGYELKEEFDCVLVLGGDGTILGIARKLAGGKVPFFGINLGNVGFLTAADSDDWRQRLELALQGRMEPRKCLALKWSVLRNGEAVASGYAINEIVASRGALARLINLSVKINDYDMGILRSDGIIICSPLGSSGYGVSAGGPLAHPACEVVCLTPVCPFPARVSPLVLPGKTVFEIGADSCDAYITIDGQEGVRLLCGDVAHVEGAPGAINVLSDDRSFYGKLGRRGLALDSTEGC